MGVLLFAHCFKCDEFAKPFKEDEDLLFIKSNTNLYSTKGHCHSNSHSKRNKGKPFDMIYVVGGWSKDDPSCPVEQFCPQYNEWKMTAPMIHQRSDPGVCALRGVIYTVGGRDELGLSLSTVEKYDPDTFRWSPVRAMNNKRFQVSLVQFDGFLLAIGGSDGVRDLKTMEAYDHETNSWRHFGSMKFKHPGGHVALVKAV
ncbi:kelch 20 [Labeo rohita]|uniref:Kelch 20 n=1 Tax=Labeo rohita TaxID=84645 RepID=A0A498NGZ0_LABRO|nr:kelch 20 [Labeo rohita]